MISIIIHFHYNQYIARKRILFHHNTPPAPDLTLGGLSGGAAPEPA